MRHRTSLDTIGLNKDRYLELLHFCRQYSEWKYEASNLIGIRGHGIDGMPGGSAVSDPVARAAEHRENVLKKIDLIDSCARQVKDGAWATALIQNICMGKSYDAIDKMILPTSNRGAFFSARKEFFQILNSSVNRRDKASEEAPPPLFD